MDQCNLERLCLAEEFKALQNIFIALGDETRQQIFVALLENETVGMRVPEITKRTHLSRPAVSHHLRILKDARLINMHRKGTMNYYYVDANPGRWKEVKDLTDHIYRVAQDAVQARYPHINKERNESL